MAIQDDKRELELIRLFDLSLPEIASRIGTDAVLEFNGKLIEFELKSTTKKNVSTARDFGFNHINKLKSKHWIFGIYDVGDEALEECYYGSPASMAPWLDKIEQKISKSESYVDLALKHLSVEAIFELLGDKTLYSIDDAKTLMKNNTTNQEHLVPDLPDFYFSQTKMLMLLKLQLKAYMLRGITLNNPSIPLTYIKKYLSKIEECNPQGLRGLISKTIS